ncbi:holo-ACP synthase [Geoalkalibacter ferrihydriticus]|uniref:citrate lyase holo-[acyl-carrier protein] synthase n=1 Tax=Geoalkalibacter ferrihydriticus TaxID=392333 RepID=A0A1G9USM9_9BACT|nr:citrate lyase holo-[acyl-carrier protein] synthase [Geoalkalibacter ferrihydriticus]SDM62928.1 holo-ACP synthase [Geoalkalibacter ferrihydriticus]
MLCDAFQTDLLAARDLRQTQIDGALAVGRPWVGSLCLALPGEEKTPPGALDLFAWGRHLLEVAMPGFEPLQEQIDPLGSWLLVSAKTDALSAKRIGIALENRHPAARLFDFDIYLPRSGPLSRASLGMDERPCLLCRRAARNCIRLKRHHPEEVVRAAHALIACFRNSSPGRLSD